jgi:cyclopropane fatty-acyl-phospholipid synthase-like methyltransferase
MRDMYQSEAYAEKNPTWHEEDAPWKANHIRAILTDNTAKAETFADVGCGTGAILLALEQAFPSASFSGYDVSPAAHARAKPRETARTKFFLGDITTQPERFDVLLAIDVFEHVEDYISFLKSIRGLAKSKVFHIPLDLSVQSVFRSRAIMNMRRDVGHLHYFYKDTALATLTDCGYRIIDHRYTASRLELPNQALSSQLMAAPRRLAYALHRDLAVRVLGGYSLLVLAE